jgi:hypothetical protein
MVFSGWKISVYRGELEETPPALDVADVVSAITAEATSCSEELEGQQCRRHLVGRGLQDLCCDTLDLFLDIIVSHVGGRQS